MNASSAHARTTAAGSPAWLRGAVGYEVYVKSFSDTSGDGIGDIAGVTSRLDYVKWLGIDVVWLTPFFVSPGLDHGYDIASYCEIDPQHGDLDAVDALIARAHQLGIRVVFDLVANHTSVAHRWFETALADPLSPERDYYLFRDPSPDGGPPNNWLSHFGGPAWTLDESSGQYWCHLFLPEQPDLNWRNPAVRAEFDAILRFWFERGVDGFRVDVAHALTKHPQLPDNPQIREIAPDAGPMSAFASFDHVHDLDQDSNAEIFERWHDIAASYGACLIAESGVSDPARLARYVAPGKLDLAFALKPARMTWQPAELLTEMLALAEAEPDRLSWVTSNHDQDRVVSRFGDGPQGRQRALAVSTLMFSLGGVPFLYQGEELGLSNGQVDPDDRQDPIATRNGIATGRDLARTPMPWNPDINNGFSIGQPWLRSAQRPQGLTVAGQHENPRTPLHRYRRLISLRRHYPELWQAPHSIVSSGRDDVAVVQRGRTLTVANLSPEPFAINLGDRRWRVVFASQGADGDAARGVVNIAAETSAVLVLDE